MAELIAVRRMVGVAAFAYAFAHFCLYIVDQSSICCMWPRDRARFYLTIGFVALLGLGALAATSTDKMIKRRRRALEPAPQAHLRHRRHRDLPLLLQSKEDVSEPVMMTGFFLILMIYRALIKRSAPLWAAVAGAAVGGTLFTALLEATWYAIRRHIDFWEVLGANRPRHVPETDRLCAGGGRPRDRGLGVEGSPGAPRLTRPCRRGIRTERRRQRRAAAGELGTEALQA